MDIEKKLISIDGFCLEWIDYTSNPEEMVYQLFDEFRNSDDSILEYNLEHLKEQLYEFAEWLIVQEYCDDYEIEALFTEETDKLLTMETAYLSSENRFIPSAKDMLEITEIVNSRLGQTKTSGRFDFNKRILLERLAVGYLLDGKIDRYTYHHMLKTADIDQLKLMIETILVRAFMRHIDDQIKRDHGFIIKTVFSTEENGVSYAYTDGLAGNMVFICAGNIDSRILGTLLSKLMEGIASGEIEPSDETITSIGHLVNSDQPLRTKFVKLENPEEIIKEYSLSGAKETDIVLQLVLADKNNILPDEEGYDKTFLQNISAEKRKILYS